MSRKNKISMKGNTKNTIAFAAAVLLLAGGIAGCGPSKIDEVRSRELSATLALSRDEITEEQRTIRVAKRDTLTVKDETGKEIQIMKAVRDDETGEMVAHDVINAAVITARFRNVAERHGKVDLRFEIIVPKDMQDSKWQLRFYPDMFILQDSVRLETVMITGKDYRQAQLRGYQQYEKFLSKIISDTTKFIDIRNLEIFLKRNIPEIYRFKNDTSYVSDDQFLSYYGVSEQEAVDHYTDKWAWKRNENRKANRGKMWAKYVKAPIVTEGIRLDTVLQDINGDFVYHYTQTIRTKPKLRKVDIILSGDIWESDQKIYTMNRSEPLTFYISSLSAFVDPKERYLKRVIERRADASTACYVDFAQGKADIDLNLGNNREEMGRIQGNIRDLLENEKFDLDSIVIAASASPEGSLATNDRLSARRAEAVSGHFEKYVRHYRDSVRRNSFSVTVGEGGRERITRRGRNEAEPIAFSSKSLGENWEMLAHLVDEDSTMTSGEKHHFISLLDTDDLDLRENKMSKEPYYKRMREVLYPRLRTVRFDFFLHRKGMIKDTIHTTELDSTYMRGIEALKERDYEAAVTLLRPYRDFNTAIAYVSLDYNASAMAILKELDRSAPVLYMLAVLYARAGDDQNAVQCYLDACRMEPSYVFRGNLDPEIYILIQRYGLHKDEPDPDLGY